MISEKIAKEVRDYLSKLGKVGGKRCLTTMTKEARIARAKLASDAATAKRKARKDPA